MKDTTRAMRTYPFHVPVNNLVLVKILQSIGGVCELRGGVVSSGFNGGIAEGHLPDEAGSLGWIE